MRLTGESLLQGERDAGACRRFSRALNRCPMSALLESRRSADGHWASRPCQGVLGVVVIRTALQARP